MNRRYYVLAMFIALLVPFFLQCSHVGSAAIINSLMNIYTAEKEAADYVIEGNIFGKRYWRTRRYVYYTVNLRVVDKGGNIIMTFRNQEPFMQQLVDEFTMNLVASLKE